MRGGVLAGVATGTLLVAAVTVSASLLLPPPGAAVGPAVPSVTNAPVADAGPPEGAADPVRTDARIVPRPAPAESAPGAAAAVPASTAPQPAEPATTASPSAPPTSAGLPTRPLEDATATLPAPEAPQPRANPVGQPTDAPGRADRAAAPAGQASPPLPPDVVPLEGSEVGAPDAESPATPLDVSPSNPGTATPQDPLPTVGSSGDAAFTARKPAATAPPEAPEVDPKPAPDGASAAESPPTRAPAPGRIALVPGDEVLTPPPTPASGPDDAAVMVEPSGATGAAPRRVVLDSARDVAAADGMAEPPNVPSGGALADGAVAFDDASGLPRLAIVLIDAPPAGADAETDGAAVDTIGPGALTGLDVVVTVAIDPTRPDAAAAARAWRAAGHEVVLLSSPPVEGATAQDVEVALAGARAAVPQAVGLLDDGEGARPDPATRAALLPALAEAGMGFVGPPDGLGSDVAAARDAGLPALSLYRVLDDAGESGPVIVRYLDRAAFEADRAGGVVVAGHATARMLAALRDWRAGDRAETVATVPLSAVLTDPRAGGAGATR